MSIHRITTDRPGCYRVKEQLAVHNIMNNLSFYQSQKVILSQLALGGYPTWDDESVRGLGQFVGKLTENQRRARLLGKELDAALEDPRWAARVS